MNHSHAGPANLDATRTSEPGVAHPARAYNAWIDGKDHSSADRKAVEELARCRPQAVAGARANSSFLARVVRYVAAQRDIWQFLYFGPGLAAPDNAHEVAQAADLRWRVVHADNDLQVVSHARAGLAGAPEGAWCYVLADLSDPTYRRVPGTRCDTAVSAPTAEGLTGSMVQAEQAASPGRGHERGHR